LELATKDDTGVHGEQKTKAPAYAYANH